MHGWLSGGITEILPPTLNLLVPYDLKLGAYIGHGFDSHTFHSWGVKAFDGVGESGINANNIVSFERTLATA